ncbi:hypothetical protein [Agarilytica rhodophyticola]|nr:hypothetical protein [Agarilytica rhodophyticola]
MSLAPEPPAMWWATNGMLGDLRSTDMDTRSGLVSASPAKW